MHSTRDASDGDIIPRKRSIILFDGRGALAFMDRVLYRQKKMSISMAHLGPGAGRARLAQAESGIFHDHSEVKKR